MFPIFSNVKSVRYRIEEIHLISSLQPSEAALRNKIRLFENGLLPVGGNYIYVRPVYKVAYQLLLERDTAYQQVSNDVDDMEERSERPDRGVLFTGHPGIGKSYFISYVLVRRLLEGKSTVLQVDSKGFYAFTSERVQYYTGDSHPSDSLLMLAENSSVLALFEWKPHEFSLQCP
ncbi:hypothetical protein EV426DRAFT_105553 [Tirmania nivea]|nr:hypothetical protein EV426DRAFT_105553 [Tirmania nivea]